MNQIDLFKLSLEELKAHHEYLRNIKTVKLDSTGTQQVHIKMYWADNMIFLVFYITL